MTDDDLQNVVAEAKEHLRASGFRDRAAIAAVYTAERKLAESEGGPWAEPIDLPARWDIGAPLPHVVSNGSSAVLICHAAVRDPDWGGSYVRIVSPSDSAPDRFMIIRFTGCNSIRFGGPNDEAMHGHPLSSRGLEPYSAHQIHNSTWTEEARQINSVHPHHSDESYKRLTHYFLAFHDDTFEALARSLDVEVVDGVLGRLLAEAAQSLILD